MPSNTHKQEETVLEEETDFLDIYLSVSYISWTVVLLVTTLIGAVIPPALAYIKAGNHRVRLTTQRIIVESGLFSTHYEEIELFRVKDSSFSNSALSRRGTVKVISTDATAPVLKIRTRRARELREQLRDLVNAEKERRGVSYRETM